MTISLECACGKLHQVPDEFAGKKIKCSECFQILPVPRAGSSPSLLSRSLGGGEQAIPKTTLEPEADRPPAFPRTVLEQPTQAASPPPPLARTVLIQSVAVPPPLPARDRTGDFTVRPASPRGSKVERDPTRRRRKSEGSKLAATVAVIGVLCPLVLGSGGLIWWITRAKKASVATVHEEKPFPRKYEEVATTPKDVVGKASPREEAKLPAAKEKEKEAPKAPEETPAAPPPREEKAPREKDKESPIVPKKEEAPKVPPPEEDFELPAGTIAGGLGGRSGELKEKLLRRGSSAASEAAVAAGLRFLALHQAADGHWGLDDFNRHARTEPLPAGQIVPDNGEPMTKRKNDTAGTAFGLLPFLAAGITTKPPKDRGQLDYSKGVERGLAYLMAKQSKAAADRGYFGGDMYSHGIATVAMCEAYGLTSDPRIKVSAQLGLNYIVSAQDPVGGGWRYAPRTSGDTSVTGWQVMALKSGQMAGLSVPRATLNKVEKFLDSCETNDKGGYGYLPSTRAATPALTAVGALCRQYLGVSPRNASLLSSVKRIKTNPPGTYGLYYEYYATQVMHHMGGEAWSYWNLGPDGTGKKGMRDALIARQDKGEGGRPGQAGSFPGDDYVGGRLGATSLSLLSLQVYYRHVPLYRRDAGVAEKEK